MKDTNSKMILPRLALLALAWLFNTSVYAQSSPVSRLTPFTTTSQVKVLATVSDPAALAGCEYRVIIKAPDSTVLWEGPVQAQIAEERGIHHLTFMIGGLSPVLWTPAHPFLYTLQLQWLKNGQVSGSISERAGFRSFAAKNGQLYLNGKPVFLRGIAINPPGRGIPDSLETSRAFAEDYVRFMKSMHVNIIRIPDDETWYDVCDEQGMMVFGGNYGGSVAGGKPPQDQQKAVDWYKNEKLGPIAHHPALMIYAMTNEVPFTGRIAEQWHRFLSYAHPQLQKWDDTRAYIANAGYGYGRAGDICDLHRYWGWYYSSPFTFLHIRNNADMIPFKKGVQPITFTECVGNYTGPDGRYNLSPDHKNPGSQLNWTGHAPQALQARLADEHQSFTFKQATELFRRLRAINPELSGVFPFTILFHNWNTIKSFVDMSPKAVTEQARLSYQPVLLSWECWTPQVYAGTTLQAQAHIVNDDDDFRDLEGAALVYELLDEAGRTVYKDSLRLPEVKYYATVRQALSIPVPPSLSEGYYELAGHIVQQGRTIGKNHYRLFIAGKLLPRATLRQPLQVYDPAGATIAALRQLSIPFAELGTPDHIRTGAVLLIGENTADDRLRQYVPAIRQFIKAGGSVLALRQDSAHIDQLNALLPFPVRKATMDLDEAMYPPPARPSRNGYYINPERPAHPVFNGIEREQLKVWSDYTQWNESQPGFPAIYPVTDGFVLGKKEDLRGTAVLGNYGVGLEGIALAEMFDGKGSALVCAFDLARRADLDPVAARLLTNLVSYAADGQAHTLHPVVTAPIIWGDYASEQGLLTGINSGLLLHTQARLTGSLRNMPVHITEDGHQFAGARGGWNTRPGLQYLPYGRRPFGPYILRGFGGVPTPVKGEGHTGTGFFWCSVPAGKTRAVTWVWNPAAGPLSISIRINDQPPVNKEIGAGQQIAVECPVSPGDLKMTFTGDRRLVLKQTAFE